MEQLEFSTERVSFLHSTLPTLIWFMIHW